VIHLILDYISSSRESAREHRRWVALQDGWIAVAAERGFPLEWDAADSWPLVRRPVTVAGIRLTVGQEFLGGTDPNPVPLKLHVGPISTVGRRLRRRARPFLDDAEFSGVLDAVADKPRVAREFLTSDCRAGLVALAHRLRGRGSFVRFRYEHGDMRLSWWSPKPDVGILRKALDMVLAVAHRSGEVPYR
jgi:hypothetical protein